MLYSVILANLFCFVFHVYLISYRDEIITKLINVYENPSCIHMDTSFHPCPEDRTDIITLHTQDQQKK